MYWLGKNGTINRNTYGGIKMINNGFYYVGQKEFWNYYLNHKDAKMLLQNNLLYNNMGGGIQ